VTSKTLRHLLMASVFGASLFGAPAFAQAAGDKADVIVVTGTRVADRSALDTVVPVDVVTSAQITQHGATDLNQVLATTLPSFNFPHPAATDGTDNIKPATLRGLAPDQTLVLLNSKRQHSSALVNLNGSVGRGAAAVDLNTIPTAAIGSIEVLRDGASAQYGSDAIAGVVNVLLKEEKSGGGVTVNFAQRDTEFDATLPALPAGATWTAPNKRHAHDGTATTVSAWQGVPIGDSGFLTVSGEYLTQDPTNRSLGDPRQQYATPSGGGFDARETSFNRIDGRYGDPENEQVTLFANGGYDTGKVNFYGWGGYQHRDAETASLWRRPSQSNNVPAIYPDGFLPFIQSTVNDYSFGGGAKFNWLDWKWDASLTYGENKIDYDVNHSLNASLGAASPTHFDAGGLDYNQWVANLGAVHDYNIGLASPLNVAFGFEGRQEFYKIRAGEPDSYRAGPIANQAGASNFPGFQPGNAVDVDRTAVAAYLDLEVNLLTKLLADVALRTEHYSDFGDTTNGKVALRYDFVDWFALRGAVSTGFRAPSLQQTWFTSTATVADSGLFLETGTFPASSSVSRSFGSQDLRPEKSTNASLGAVVRAGGFNFTLDAYQIWINDQILLSGNLPTSALPIAQRPAGIQQARFFINGVDTKTFGIDAVASYSLKSTPVGRFDFTLAGAYNNLDIIHLPRNNQFTSTVQIFDRVAQVRFEDGQPPYKVSFSTDWSYNNFSATFRATDYGGVKVPQSNAALDYELGSKTLIDLEGRYDFGDHFKFAIGAENLLDEYPTSAIPAVNTSGAIPYSQFSPFGFNGRLLYARVAYLW
jgi:iron complex outermembrane receptor protein